ncbi:polysaccharide deacetylase family protein [archaeon]|nr:polysaccharide deacetylase family protein [archaeon]
MGEKLSLCMIAKNEEKFLVDCLNSVKDIVDEIILVDTGSKDKTVEIAKSFGAKVFHFDWGDDFSEPRNISLRKATGDWILVLDPDERLAAEDILSVKKLLSEKPCAYSMPTINYSYAKKPFLNFFESDKYADMNEGLPFYWISNKIRIFSNNKEIIFQGPVHELVEPSIRKAGLEVKQTDIPVHHYAQLDEKRSRQKRFFYMNITRKKVLRDPNNAKAYLELGREYFNLRLYHRAIQTFRKGLSLTKDIFLVTEMNDKSGLAFMKLKKFSEAEKCFLNALEHNDKSISAADNLFQLYKLQGIKDKTVEARNILVKVLFNNKKYENVVEHLATVLNKPLITNFNAYYYLIKSYEQLGDKNAAQEWKQKLSLQGVPTLSYHDIGDSDSVWSIPIEEFKAQILFLKKEGFEFVTVDKIDFKKKQVAITFDDGRLSVFEKAIPFLEKHKIKVTLFITTDWIEGKNIPETENYSDFMTWDQVKKLSSKGHLIASHTISHRDLSFLDEKNIGGELCSSKELLKDKIGFDVNIVSYPFGHFNNLVLNYAKKNHYDLGVTEEFGFCQENSLTMPRIYILKNISIDTFKRLFSSF